MWPLLKQGFWGINEPKRHLFKTNDDDSMHLQQIVRFTFQNRINRLYKSRNAAWLFMENFLTTKIIQSCVKILFCVGKVWFLTLVIWVARWEISTQAWHKRNIDLIKEIVLERHLVPMFGSYWKVSSVSFGKLKSFLSR